MRRKIVAGNWKMNTTLEEGIELAKAVSKGAEAADTKGVTLVVAPPFTHLTEIKKVLSDSAGLAAQNCSTDESGAFTGEVSAKMLKSAGIQYVIIGHSERRMFFKETDADLNKKVYMALENGLTPIFCCGENLHEREKGIYTEVVRKQIELGLAGLSDEQFSKIVIAYEPVWAIGTGKTASPDQAQEMHHFIRNLIKDSFNNNIADNTSILYGGSCKPSNASELFANVDVDGGLIGGASLNADDFLAIAGSF